MKCCTPDPKCKINITGRNSGEYGLVHLLPDDFSQNLLPSPDVKLAIKKICSHGPKSVGAKDYELQDYTYFNIG